MCITFTNQITPIDVTSNSKTLRITLYLITLTISTTALRVISKKSAI